MKRTIKENIEEKLKQELTIDEYEKFTSLLEPITIQKKQQ